MRSVEDHLGRALATARPLSALDLPLLDARGCVLAADLVAGEPVPSFDSAATDGYAVRAADVASASLETPAELRVSDDVPAGFRASEQVGPGTAIKVADGALLPGGTQAVVAAASTDHGTEMVRVFAPVTEGANIKRAGSDAAEGEMLLRAGAALGAGELALAAACRRQRVAVHPRPRVVIITVGTGLADPGTVPEAGLKTDTNGVCLAAAAADAGALAFRVGPVPEIADRLLPVLEDQLVRADLIVTVGGIGRSADSPLRAVLGSLGSVEFGPVALHPAAVHGSGTLGPDGVPVLSLPGSPGSAFVGFEQFVRPVIRRMLGHAQLLRPVVRTVLDQPVASVAGVSEFVPGTLTVTDGRYHARPVAPASAAAGSADPHRAVGVRAIAAATCLISVPADVPGYQAGDPVTAMRLDED